MKPRDLAKTLLDKYKVWTVAIDTAADPGATGDPVTVEQVEGERAVPGRSMLVMLRSRLRLSVRRSTVCTPSASLPSVKACDAPCDSWPPSRASMRPPVAARRVSCRLLRSTW